MTDTQPSGLNRFISELRRRHVVRVALAYAAVVFVLLQLSEIVLPAFLATPRADFVVRVVVVGAVLLFPVVIAMAWIYEITPKGIRSMDELDAESGFQPPLGAFLPRFALLAITVVAAGASGLWWWRTAEVVGPGFEGRPSNFQAATTEDASGPIRSIAVLPLEDNSPSTDDAWFATSMHEALVNGVGQLSSVRALSRTSTLRYDQRGRSLAQIGAELNVDALVEGSVLVVEDQVQITVRLYHAASETQIWQQDYRRDMVDVISLQKEVAAAIAREIGLQVDASLFGGSRTAASDPEESPAIRSPELDGESEGEVGAPAPGTEALPITPTPPAAPSPEAASNYLRGRSLLVDGAPGSAESARDLFSEALEEDSSYAPALTGLAGSELVLALQDRDPREEIDRLMRARGHAMRALEADGSDPEAQDVLAAIDERLVVAGTRFAADLAEGIGVEISMDSMFRMTESGRIMVLPTGDSVDFEDDFSSMAPVVTTLGQVLQGNLGRAFRVERGSTADGFRISGGDALRSVLHFAQAGDLDEAIDVAEDLIETGTPDWRVWETLEQLHRMDGDLDEAAALRARRAEVLGPEPGPAPGQFRTAAAESEAAWRELKVEEYRARRDAGSPVLEVFAAAVLAAGGEDEAALAALRAGIEGRELVVATLRIDPAWDELRSSERFRALARAIRREAAPLRGPGRDRDPGSP